MSSKIVHEINGEKYIIIELPFVEGSMKRFNAFVERNQMIFQGIKKIDRGGLFGKAVIVHKFLLPEKNFLQYSKDEL